MTALSCLSVCDYHTNRFFSAISVFGRPFVKRFALCYRTVVLSVCLSVLSVCDVRALWPNGWTDQDETWHAHASRPRRRTHCVMGTQLPSPKRAQPLIFGSYLLWQNGCMDPDATWYGGRPRPRRLCVRWGPRFHSSKRGQSLHPKFSAHVYCGQMAGCIKMPHGMEIGLSPGNCVRWGHSPSANRGGAAQFSAHVYCGKTAAWIKIPLGTEVGLGLRDIVLDGECSLWPNRWMD